MSHRIRCYTLFDITQTNISNRSKPPQDVDYVAWLQKRNQQCNFDTILQVISLRSQPDEISVPISQKTITKYFGNQYKGQIQYWYFDFDIHHTSVFSDNDNTFGLLYNDCNSVPMIQNTTSVLSNFLDITPELKNIHFEELCINNEN